MGVWPVLELVFWAGFAPISHALGALMPGSRSNAWPHQRSMIGLSVTSAKRHPRLN